MTSIAQTSVPQFSITWPLLPDDFIIPDDPVENTDQPLVASALRQPLMPFPQLSENALIVTNFALCAAINEKIICKGPDWMYVRPVQPWRKKTPRRSYTPHTEGPIPQVVIEFISATYGEEYSTETTEEIGKWFFYEQVIKVPRYVIFRPHNGRLEVYALESECYRVQTPDASGRYWIPGLDLFLGLWQGTHDGRTGYWLRWWDAEGNILLWPEERGFQERQRAEQERERAEQERERAEQAEALLERERSRSQLLLSKLREVGIDPEQL